MSQDGSLFLPSQNSTIASEVDALFNFILYLSIIFFIIVVGGTFYFTWRYRARKKENDFTYGLAHNTKLEILWTVIPTILVFIIFLWGFQTFLKMHLTPGNAIEVNVTGQKWFWSFSYPDGVISTNELVVPVNQPVKLLMSSRDVIHSFFVPGFRIKMDVLPNRYSSTWFEATREGEYDLFCTEYCGKSHSDMIGKVRVVSETQYNQWLAENASVGSDLPPEEWGAELYNKKACITCHSIDGSSNVGPTFKGLYGRTENFTDGSTLQADENYIRESILEPQAKIVQGYQPVMPTYQGVLKPEEIDALIAFIKTLK